MRVLNLVFSDRLFSSCNAGTGSNSGASGLSPGDVFSGISSGGVPEVGCAAAGPTFDPLPLVLLVLAPLLPLLA